MPTINTNTGISAWITNLGVAWFDSTTAQLGPGQSTWGRGYTFPVPGPFAEIHDDCILTNITVSCTASGSSIYGIENVRIIWLDVATSIDALAPYGGGTLSVSADAAAIAAAGITPAMLRAATELTSSVQNTSDFYSTSTVVELPTIIVTYTDNGVRKTLFFGSNF